jgi:hypothetical protein
VEDFMKTLFAAMVFALLVVSSYGQQVKPPSRIVTTTRLVALFSGLEQELLTAARDKDHAAFDRLVSSDFQVWTPDPPGQPIPRAAWLEKFGGADRPSDFSIRQMAVRSLGQHAVVSFVLLEGAPGRQTARFIVDLWSSAANGWKLTDRYLSPVPAASYAGDRKPSGKN